MTFLSPLAALVAAALAVPALLLLYVLRLRRRPVRVASTMFWPGVRQDLEANVPFQRLRATPMLLLQLLAVLALVAALGEPVIDAGPPAAGRTIVLLDHSASMAAPADAANPAGPTRFDVAVEAIRTLVDRRTSMRGGRTPGEVMVIAFAARADVRCGFERRPAALRSALAAVQLTDGEADLEAAARLARAFLVTGTESAEAPPDLVVFSDGGVAVPDGGGPLIIPQARLDVRSVVAELPRGPDGAPPAVSDWPNLGITDMAARRGDDDPQVARVFVRIGNAGPRAVRARVRVDRDGTPVTVRTVTVPPAVVDGPLGEATFAVDVEAAEATTIQAAIVGRTVVAGAGSGADVRAGADTGASTGVDPGDLLAADDVAAVRLPSAARPRVLLVAPDARPRGALVSLIEATDPASIRTISAAAWIDGVDADVAAARDGAVAGAAAGAIDLVILDRVEGGGLPAVPSLWIGGGPDGVERRPPADDGGQRLLSWRQTHPVLRYVALDDVAYAGFGAFVPPPRAETLARGPAGPVMLEVPARGVRHVLVGFDLDRTNWTTDVGFAVFVQNVSTHLAATGRGQPGRSRRPGEPAESPRASGGSAAASVTVTGPVSFQLPPSAATGDTVVVPGLPLAGLYVVTGVRPPDDVVPVNVASAVETDLRPRGLDALRARETVASAAAASPPRDLWPWFVAAAGLLATVEWLLHLRRIRI